MPRENFFSRNFEELLKIAISLYDFFVKFSHKFKRESQIYDTLREKNSLNLRKIVSEIFTKVFEKARFTIHHT